MNTFDNIILCGFMGTGKSTVGRTVARYLGWRFVDTDKLIEDRAGRTIKAIFTEDGEAAFRKMEADLCVEMASWRLTVVATGGGMILNPANRERLIKAGIVICLEAPAQEIAARLARSTDRPLLAGDDPIKRIETLLAERAPIYSALPYHLSTDGQPVEANAERVIDLWSKART